MRVAVIDIGTPGKNLGWAIDEPDDAGTDLKVCIEILIASLREGPVALRFEAPQFVPIRIIRLSTRRLAIASPALACPRGYFRLGLGRPFWSPLWLLRPTF